jgi:hypothetical protein
MLVLGAPHGNKTDPQMIVSVLNQFDNLRSSRVGALICLVSVCSTATASAEPADGGIEASNPPSTPASGSPAAEASRPSVEAQPAPIYPVMPPPPQRYIVVLSPPPQEPTWYGWQTLIVDGAALSLTVAAFSRANSSGNSAATLLELSGITYVIGPPIVHWAHGNVGKGFGSLGMRLVAPVLGAGIGCALDQSGGELGCLGGLALGGFAGIVLAVVLDNALLAYDPAPERSQYSLVVSPWALPGAVGLGSFGTW